MQIMFQAGSTLLIVARLPHRLAATSQRITGLINHTDDFYRA